MMRALRSTYTFRSWLWFALIFWTTIILEMNSLLNILYRSPALKEVTTSIKSYIKDCVVQSFYCCYVKSLLTYLRTSVVGSAEIYGLMFFIGFRHIKLLSSSGERIPGCTLFIHITSADAFDKVTSFIFIGLLAEPQ